VPERTVAQSTILMNAAATGCSKPAAEGNVNAVMAAGPVAADGLCNEQCPATRQQAAIPPPAQQSMPASRDATTSGAWNAVKRENRRKAARVLIALKKA
jgi:hypothetical protein